VRRTPRSQTYWGPWVFFAGSSDEQTSFTRALPSAGGSWNGAFLDGGVPEPHG